MTPAAGRDAVPSVQEPGNRGAARSVAVEAGGARLDYEVLVGRGLLAELPLILRQRVPAHRWAVISDANVAELYGRDLLRGLEAVGMQADLFPFPAGERHKTRETWAAVTDALLGAGYGRDSAVAALGGGVSGDLGGFVAACFMRGLPLVQVPTTFVAMMDAAVGGKTGVDTPAGKNLVGAFHPPRLVAVDPDTVLTLPRQERAQGLVEALKHGAVLDEAYLSSLEQDLPRLLAGDPAAAEAAVLRSVELKAGVVGQDEREAGYRQVLNFGHTIGHALEAAAGYRLPHGTAVGQGMVLEARLGESLGVTEAGTSERLGRAVEALDLPRRLPEATDVERVLSFLSLDKKRRAGRIRCVLLRRAGEVEGAGGWSHFVGLEDVRSVLADGAGDPHAAGLHT